MSGLGTNGVSYGKKETDMKKQGKQEQPGEAIGLDLSDRTGQYCHLDADGGIEAEGKVTLTAAGLKRVFGHLPRTRMAIETGAQSAWVKRCLEELGHEVIMANARELQAITGGARKTDQRDAQQLARLARVDPKLLSPVELRGAQQQLDLIPIRARALLVEARTKLVNGVRGLANVEGIRLPAASTACFSKRARSALNEQLLSSLAPLLAAIEQITEAIETSEETIAQTAETRYPETLWLKQVPGVGTLTALTFVLTIGRPERFVHSRDVGPFIGLTPRRQQSGEADPQLRISKCGDKYLRKLLVQCAHHVMGRFGPDSALKQWGVSHAGGSKRAKKSTVVAVARKLAVLLHRLWSRQEEYRAFPAVAA